jgi:hypothetical protein
MFEESVVDAYVKRLNQGYHADAAVKVGDLVDVEKLVADLDLKPIKRKFKVKERTWEVSISLTAQRAWWPSATSLPILLQLLNIPQRDAPALIRDDRLVIYYLQVGRNRFARKFGEFHQPKSNRDWMELDVMSREEMETEIRKAFKLVATTDETDYKHHFPEEFTSHDVKPKVISPWDTQ